MIRRILAALLPATLTEDEQIERTLQLLRKEERAPGLLTRMVDHPIGFIVLFFGAIFIALGLAELLCTLVGAHFDPRLG